MSIFKSWKPSSVAAEAGGSLEHALITTARQCMERMPLGAGFFFLSVFELEDFFLFPSDLLVVQCGCFCRYNGLCSVRTDLFHSNYPTAKYVNIRGTHCKKVLEHNIY